MNNNKQNGHTAEYLTCYHISCEGYKPILIPQSHSFDVFVTGDDGALIRVQVKSSNAYSTKPTPEGRKVVVPYGYVWNLQIGYSKKERYNFDRLEIFALVNLPEERIAFLTAKELSIHPTKVTIKLKDMAKYTWKRAINLLRNIDS